MAGQNMNPKLKRQLYVALGAACLLIAAGLALRNLNGPRVPAEYLKAVVVAAIGLFFILVRGGPRRG
jgi:hypothetical protein